MVVVEDKVRTVSVKRRQNIESFCDFIGAAGK